MRSTLTFPAAVVLGVALAGGVMPLSRGQAADTPSAAQIIDQLTPGDDGLGLKRGIRLGGQPPADGKPSAAAVSTGTVRPAESNLSVPFAFRSAAISPAGAIVLDQLGMALANPKLAGFKFRVEGHTDTVGAPEMNRALSQRRAISVTNYLVRNYNIDPARLTPAGMGEDGLLVATGPGVPNAANRRVLVINLGR